MPEDNPLLPIVRKYFERDIVAATHSLETMDQDEAAHVLKELPASIEPQFAATIFIHLPDDARESLLQHIPDKMKAQTKEFLTYPEDSVGRIMSTDFLSFHKDIPTGQVR